MSKELNQLKGQAIIIRDEDQQGLNTSERVGSLFLDIVEWLDEHKKDASSSGGGGGSSDFTAYNPILSINAINGNPNTSNQVLVWTGNSWGYRDYQTGGSGGGTSLTDVWASLRSQDYTKQINYSHLTDLEWWGCKFNNGSVINGKIIAPNGIQIGGATITWDGSALKVDKTLYSTSGVSALGNDSSSGGGGGGGTVDLNEPLSSINALNSNPSSSDTKILVWRTGSWGYENLPSGGGSSTDVYWNTILGTPPGVSTFSNDVPYLTSSSISDMATKTWVGQQGYLTSSAISDMATKTWVNQQGFLTSSSALDASNLTTGTVSFSRLPSMYWANVAVSSSSSNNTEPMFRTVNINGIIVEYDSNKQALKFNGNIYATGNVSALGSASSSGGGASTLEDLLDTIINNPSSGQILKYNGSKWINSDESSTYVHPTNGANTTITNASGKVLSAITVNSLGHVTSVSSKTLASGDIPDLSWSKITTGKPTTLAGYGITDALSSSTTFWGRTASNGVVSGDMTNVGSITMTGNVKMNRGTHISFRTSTSSTSYLSALGLNNSNALNIGVGTASVGNTILYGTNIRFIPGSSSTVDAAEITSTGQLYIKQSTQGLRIGDGLLTWDSGNNAFKVQKYNGASANLYADGSISALGMSEGTSTVDSMTFNYLKVNNSLRLPGTIVTGTSAMLVRQAEDSPCIYLFNDFATSKISFHSYYFNQYNNVGLKGTDYGYSDSWFIDPDGAARFSRIYLDSVRYLYISKNTLCYYDGSTRRTIQFS